MKSDSEVVILNKPSQLQNNKEQEHQFLFRSASTSEDYLNTSESSTKLITKMDDSSKRILIRISMDVIILCIVGFPILFFFLWGEPYKRGFFCDDESLKHPFHDSTVKSWMLYLFGIVLPVLVIAGTEYARVKVRRIDGSSLKLYKYEVPYWMIQAYKNIGVFAFGAASSQLATDIGKYTIGRLRPHFYSVCNPVMLLDNSTCNDSHNLGIYHVDDYKCTGDSSERMLKEMRLSFPSGHSSFSAYTMVYCAIYLHQQMSWRQSKLFKHFLQFLFIMMTWYTCLSRISDYKHHWSDVLAGGTLGAITAIIVANYCSDLFNVRRNAKLLPETRHELHISPSNHINSNGNS